MMRYYYISALQDTAKAMLKDKLKILSSYIRNYECEKLMN